MKFFDKAYDAITYTLIMLCYIAAGWMIIMLMMGYDTLMNAAACTAMGIALSIVFIRIKSQTNE